MPAEVRVPTLGESVVEATIARWHKREGDRVDAGDPLVELETDKVNTELSADRPGVLRSILKGEGDIVRPGDVVAAIEEGAGGAAPETAAPESAAPAEAPAPAAEEDVRASPLAHRLAEDLGVDLARVPATGPGGRVTREDVETFAQRSPAPSPQPQAPAVPAPLAAAPRVETPSTETRGETRQRLSRRRLTIARRLVEAQQTAAMLTTFNEVDLSAVMAIRQRRKESFKEQHGVGLGFMSFFTKAAVGALKAFPEINSELQGEELVRKHYYDIGIAIGAEEGLVVPVLRNADRLSFAEIEREIAALAKKAKERTLTLDDLKGGTFTITNGGVFGSLLSTPILNPPQVGILGMHKIQERPVVENGEVVVRPMMYLALSYDHRVVDGREAVQFLVRIKELIEEPERLLLEG
ncbi:MAG: 2-oxoglutarate dehydrogenase complex dihydrolipoyllysine-residue succinyltransferase [Armatimonadota bacterium]